MGNYIEVCPDDKVVEYMKEVIEATNDESGGYKNVVALYGPPATGKDTLVDVTCSLVKDCTYFDIPTDFGRHNPALFQKLFEYALECKPAVIFFNECEGLLKKKGWAA